MKYGKLVEIKRKAQQYEKVVFISFMAEIILLFTVISCIFKRGNDGPGLYILFGLASVFAVLMIVFTRLEGRQERAAVDYFMLRIMEVINEQGIEADKFEFFQKSLCYYRVGFHNQIVDYSNLQAVIDKEAVEMSKIMKMNIRVELI